MAFIMTAPGAYTGTSAVVTGIQFSAATYLPAGFGGRLAASPGDHQGFMSNFFGYSAYINNFANSIVGPQLNTLFTTNNVTLPAAGAASISGASAQQSSAQSTLTSLLGALLSRLGG